jgi:hypothetical protein
MDNEKKKEKDEVILSHNFIPDWMEYTKKMSKKINSLIFIGN